MIALQVEVVKEVLSIEYISVVGLLLLACVAMAYVIKKMIDRCDEKEISHSAELKEKDDIIKDFGIKYYVLQEKIYTILEIQKKNSDV